jgi:hypothetical protein
MVQLSLPDFALHLHILHQAHYAGYQRACGQRYPGLPSPSANIHNTSSISYPLMSVSMASHLRAAYLIFRGKSATILRASLLPRSDPASTSALQCTPR